MEFRNDKTGNRRRYKSRYRSAHSYKAKRVKSSSPAVLVAVLTFVVLASLVVVFTFGDSIYNALDQKLQAITATEKPTVAPTQDETKKPKETKKPTQAPTEAPTQPPAKQDDQFMKLLKANDMAFDDINGSQLVFVDADADALSCKVYCYEKDADGKFIQAIGPFDGYIGAEGIDEMVTPYESKTPVGKFAIEYAFGSQANPGCGLEYSQFTIYDYWVTDPASINYNRWMVTEDNKDWESAQWLYEYTLSYPHAIVFDYNRSSVDPSQGCAKFIHVSDGPTSGGVGIAESDIEALLYWLNISASPYVCISK